MLCYVGCTRRSSHCKNKQLINFSRESVSSDQGCIADNGGCEEKCNDVRDGIYFCSCDLPGKVRSPTDPKACVGEYSDTVLLPSQQFCEVSWLFTETVKKNTHTWLCQSCESHNMTPSSQIWTNVKATWRTTVRTPAATPWSATRVSAPKVSRSVHTHLSNVDVGGGTSVTVLMVRLTCLHSCINFTDRYLSQCSSYAVWQLLAKKWNIDVKHKTSKQTKKQLCQHQFN